MKKKKKKKNNKKKICKLKFDYILIILFLTGCIFIYSTYAWFSSTLDVEISNFNVKVDTEVGLSISLDGINWGSSVDISEYTILDGLNNLYSNNTNRWSNGLYPVSTVGLLNYGDDKFSIFEDDRLYLNKEDRNKSDYIYSTKSNESTKTKTSRYIAFDIFLKNITNSPYSDNLYIANEDNIFTYTSELDEAIINSARLGIVYIGTTNKKSSAETIQNLTCATMCQQIIYEPSISHTEDTIEYVKKYGVTSLKNDDSEVFPTYALIRDGKKINIWSGIHDSNVEYDEKYFLYQNTITSLDSPIFKLPNGISKYRIYVWLEGQDIDSIKFTSKGYNFKIQLQFEKDLAGYS
jgi:hypothetical protein